MRGEFVADKPDLELSMIGPIEAYIDYQITSTQTWTSEQETISESEREETNLTSYASEIRTHYGEKLSAGGSAEASVQAGLLGDLGGAFKAALNLGANVEKSFTQTRVWKLEKSTKQRLRDMVRNVTSTFQSGTISMDSKAGRLTGYLRLENTSRRPITLLVSDLHIDIWAYHPVTASKQFAARIEQNKPASQLPNQITLPAGSSYTIAVNDIPVSTSKLLTWLEQGYTFGAQMSGQPTLATPAGFSVADLLTKVNSRTAQVTIRGYTNSPFFYDVSIYAPDGRCKSIRDLLEDGIRTRYPRPDAPDIEFAKDPDGNLFVNRVYDETNVHHDKDFEDLGEGDRDEYRKWVVAYVPGPYSTGRTAWDLDTVVAPSDRIFLYLLTRADFETPPEEEPPSYDPLADDVGIIAGTEGCPINTARVTVHVDGENDEPYNGAATGWRGMIDADKKNARITLCRVDGGQFHPTVWATPNGSGLPPVALDKYAYGLFKLGNHCPVGSSEYRYSQDTEDDSGEWTRIEGSGAPGINTWPNGSGITWRICVFRYNLTEGAPRAIAFPDFGTEYGVLAAPAFEGAGAMMKDHPRGSVLMDDEEHDNDNDAEYFGNAEVQEVGDKIFYETPGHNTMMKMVRVQ